jgi:hypothetical protein
MWQYYHLPLHRAIVIAVYTEAQVPEIMDTPSYNTPNQRNLLLLLLLLLLLNSCNFHKGGRNTAKVG